MAESVISVNYSDMNFSLKNGINMPAVGLGTFRLTNYDVLYKTIDYAIEAGYRLFDTATMHNNERHLKHIFQKLLPERDLTRENIFITTKIAPSADGRFFNNAFEKSLSNIGMEYIDLYLIHFPGSPYSDPQNKKHAKLCRESWLALVRFYDESKARAIGVSNFTIRHLMQLSEVMAVGPMVNQTEWHPYYHQPEVLQYCYDHNIRIQAFNSFDERLSQGNRDLIEGPLVTTLARKYRTTSTQVLLVWALQKGVAVIPTSTNPYHIRKNKQLHFHLSERDVMTLDELSIKNLKYSWDPTLIA